MLKVDSGDTVGNCCFGYTEKQYLFYEMQIEERGA